MNFRFLVIFTTLLAYIKAEVDVPFYTQDQLALQACTALVGKTATFCPAKGKASKKVNYKCYCKNALAIGTLSQCYMELGNITSQIEYFLNTCEEKANATITLKKFYNVYENSTKYLVDPTADDFNSTLVSYSPVKLSSKKVSMYFRSYRGRFMNYNTANYFGTIMIAYWGVVMLVAAVFNWTVYFFPKLSNNAVVKKYRQYLSLPAVHRSHASDSKFLWFFHYLIPSRLDTVLIGSWIALCIAFESGRYEMVYPNAVWKSKEAMVGRLIADRSGITSLYCFPILILFAGRNNFLQFFTRWKFSRMIAIHRWVARITVLIVFIHTVSMSASGWALGKFYSRNQQAYVIWGWVAMVCGVIILVQSCLYLRRRSYEAFYITHLLMATFFTIGGWRHVDNEGYGPWYYAAVAVWAFDRIVRIVRLCIFGFPHARVELRAEETLKVTVPRPAWWKAEPQQHAFIHFLRPSCFWQSHPFTIVNSYAEDDKINFFIKIKGGVTHGLYKYLSKQENRTANIRVSIEGPYGSRVPVQRFDNVLLLGGGNGIPGLFDEAMQLVKKDLSNQTVNLVWVIRHWKSLDWFAEELKRFENTKVTPLVFVTNPKELSGLDASSPFPSSSSSSDSETGSDLEEKKHGMTEKTTQPVDPIERIKDYLPHVEFEEGRPDIEQLVKQKIEEANGSLAVVACAHSSMVDDARAAVAHNMSSTKNLVEFYDQLQVW